MDHSSDNGSLEAGRTSGTPPFLLRRLLNSGAGPGLSATDIRHLRTTNIAALIGAAAIGVWVPLAFATVGAFIAIQNGLASLAFLSVVAINRAGRPLLAVGVLMMTTHVQVVFALYMFGFASGAALFYVVLIVAPYMTFPRSHRGVAHGCAVLACAGWVLAAGFQAHLPRPGDFPMSGYAQSLMNTVCVVLACMALAWGFSSEVDEAEEALDAERARADALLLNILPASIGERLKRNSAAAIADGHDAVTVLFADIVGFTPLSQRVEPEELVAILNRMFTRFDDLSAAHGVEKIKTIGDAYMAASGLPSARPDHAAAAAELALDLRQAVAELGAAFDPPLRIRIGLHTGKVVAGVIGKAKFSYDLWGDTVNTAARMESHGAAGEIQVSEATREALGDAYVFEDRGVIEVKGKGALRTWLLKARANEG